MKFAFLTSLLLILSCNKAHQRIENYNFKDGPDRKIILDSYNDEVSGLANFNDTLFLHNDEEATISMYTINNLEYLKKIKLIDKNGNIVRDDFEGIARRKNELYLINSDGDIYKCISNNRMYYKFQKYRGPKGSYEFEALCYDPVSDMLVTITKDVKKKKHRDKRFVFRFDPNHEKYEEEAHLTLYLKDLRTLTNRFYPSGMELHPILNSYFIISAKSNLIIELSRSGKILRFNKLNKKRHRQAEGITFDSRANLYITDEAKGKEAILSVYDYLSN